ncbi:unnamed protein product [Cyclocybe aegerita]|uniref:Uncharacterized protein n=1 Tax=Cyclocybe aegerita TaxID=1973307 RepID=A0A8S0W847_CYCAE|nr:unnamed protein product [Cyclocybe aegerita]
MFVPRTDAELDGCPSDRILCVPSSAILGTTDTASARGTDDDDTGSYDPNYMLRPGVHRYIGIIMVSVLAVLAILLWVYVARYRKSATPRDFWCCTGKRKPAKPGPFEREEEGASTAASSTETLSGVKEGHGGEQRVSRQGGGVSEKDGHVDARGVIKEVSGGVVMFTQAPKAAWRGARDRESHHHYSPRSHRSHGHPSPHPPTSPPTTTTTRTPTRTWRTRTTSPSSRSPATPPGVVVLSDAEWTQHEQHVHGVRYEVSRV